MTLEFRVGDCFERLAEIPDGSIDLVVTSPPFLALRSYLPADHPDKAREIGSEATPADFIETLLALTAEFGRVLAPHGSICVELGDTFSGSGNGPDAMKNGIGSHDLWLDPSVPRRGGAGWPLPKSLTGIPTLYAWSLAYGRNLLSGAESSAGRWRIRNVIVWARPNPPVGALGDKFRPATSYITVACKSGKRYFDLDAVRTEAQVQMGRAVPGNNTKGSDELSERFTHRIDSNPAGAPPLDWHADDHPEDGDWLWKLSTAPYRGSHYATFPLDLPRRLIEAMCPQRVCLGCGRPSERITERTPEYAAARSAIGDFNTRAKGQGIGGSRSTLVKATGRDITSAEVVTVGWTHCGCGSGCRPTTWRTDLIEVEQVKLERRWVDADSVDDPTGLPTRTKRKRKRVIADAGECVDPSHWRTGVVLDPFAGSGTTIAAAQLVGRYAIGIDLDERNAELARDRVGMFLETVAPGEQAPQWEQLPMWEATA